MDFDTLYFTSVYAHKDLLLCGTTWKIKCQIPGMNNDTYNVQNNQHASIINRTIPPSHDEIHKYDRCHYYQYRNNSRNRVKCSKWNWQKENVLLSTIITLAMAVAVAFSQTFYVFVILEFMIGAAHHGGFMICCVMTKVNKKKIPSRMIDEKTLENPKTANVYHLFSTLEMTKRTIILLWNWIVIAMVYYGVTMHTGGNIGGNFYLNFFILAIVEVPAKLLVMATLNRAGRKRSIVSVWLLEVLLVCVQYLQLYMEVMNCNH
ncbi:OCTN [Mytilus edulis]|uniref:SLC22A4_5 n=1 Tax=Mytilus edulis TaxID=6550 RepID=A0A8S3R0W8_MYTED|nr:OCTN [Mytilus edulis]